MPEEKPGLAEKVFYIFLLGLSTYLWWRFTGEIKRKITEG